MSKVDKVKTIYLSNAGKTRKEIIKIIQETLNVSEVSASSYYSTVKRQAKEGLLDQTIPKEEPAEQVETIVESNEESEPVFVPSRKRTASSNRKFALDIFFENMTPEEQAAWPGELQAMLDDGKPPVFAR